MKKIYLFIVFVLVIANTNGQLLQLLPADIPAIANGSAASILKQDATVKIQQIGVTGTAATYVALDNSNATPVLNATGNDAITIESTSDITSLVLKYAANSASTANPYVGYSPTISPMGSATVAISSCEMTAGVTGTVQTTVTYTVPAGTRFIILVRNKACSPTAASSVTIRISQIDVGYVTGPAVPTVTTTAASSIAATTASSGGNVTADGGSAVFRRGLVYSTGAIVDTTSLTGGGKLIDGAAGTGSFTTPLTGLTPNTLYHIRAFALNAIGVSYGADLTFTTTLATTDYYNVPGSDITINTNWGTNTNGTGTNPTNFSTAGQIFNLINPGSTMSAPLSISGASSKLVLGDGAGAISFTVPAANALTAPVDIKSNANLILQNAVPPAFGVLSPGSTVTFDGVLAPSFNYQNLSLLNGGNFASGSTIGIAGIFNPGAVTTATVPSTVNFNGTAAQTIPSFFLDSLAITNTAGCSTAGAPSVIAVNRGLKISNPFTIAALDSFKLMAANGVSMVIDASKTLVVNGNLILKNTVAPTVTGTMTVNSGGKYIVDANTGNSAGFIPTATYNSGSEILVLQGAPRLPATIGGNVVWSSVGTGSYLNSNTTIGGNLTFNAGGVNHGSGGTSRSLTVSGNLVMNGGVYSVLGAPGSGATNQDLTVNGNVIIAGGSLFATAGTTGTGIGTVNIKGNLNHTSGSIGNNNATNTSGRFIFNGSSAQTINTTGFVDSVNVTIGNAAGVTLSSGNIDLMNGTLTFTAGKLFLGANNFAAGAISGATSSNYVVTDGAGALKINNVGASNVTYPVGPSSASYNPVVLNNAGTADNFSVNVSAAAPPPGINVSPQLDSAVNRTWNISEDVAGGSNATVTLQWDAAHQNSLFAQNNCAVVHSDGSVIDYSGGYTTASPAGSSFTQTGTGFTSFSPFGVASRPTGPLPLSLLSFNATLQGSAVKLFWNTTNEINVSHFTIEKSTDGRTYNSIGTIAAQNGAASNNYSFTDAAIQSGVVYYRLKMVDRDGKFKYSQVIAINSKKADILSVFPNPVADNLFVTHGKATTGAKLEVYAADGRKITQYSVAKDAVQTNVSAAALPAGNYNLVFVNGTDVQFIKFVKR